MSKIERANAGGEPGKIVNNLVAEEVITAGDAEDQPTQIKSILENICK